MELKIYNPVDGEQLQAVDFNFAELKQDMTARLAKYQDLVYTDDTIREAKVDRATLNKFRDAIENKRKEVKKFYLAPYEAFEKQIKELTALVDAPILAIDGQVKSFEQQQKEEKKIQIQDYYSEHIGNLVDLLPFDRIFIDRWLNSTVTFKEISDTINTTIERITSDLQTIADLKSDFELQVKDTYLRTLDLSAALNEKTRLEQQKTRLEEYQKQQAQEVQEVQEVPPAPQKPIQHSYVEPREPEVLRQIDFRVWATDTQLLALKSFLKLNNMKYGRVE